MCAADYIFNDLRKVIGLNRIGIYLCNLVEMSTVDASFHCLPVITVSVVIGGFMYGFALKLWWVLALWSPYRHSNPWKTMGKPR